MKRFGDVHREKAIDLEKDVCQWQARAEGEKQKVEEVFISLRLLSPATDQHYDRYGG